MENIRLKKITVAPLQSPLIIHNGNVQLLDTRESSNMLSGSFISNGGISINCTYDSINSTVGGTLTVGGGVGIAKSLFIGKNLNLDNSNSTMRVFGLSEDRLFLDTVSNKKFHVSVDGVNKRFELYDTYLNINITTPSTNSSSGSLIINGGISINNTTDSSSSTQGGALTISGGMGINKNARIGQNLYVQGSNYIEDSLYVKSNITASNLYLTSGFTSSSILSTNINATNISTNTLNISSTLNAFGNSNTIGSIITSDGNVGIGTTSLSSYKLSVVGSVDNDNLMYLKNSSSTGSTTIVYENRNGASAYIGISSSANANTLYRNRLFLQSPNDTVFTVNGDNTSSAMMIQGTTGNIGIGNDNPLEKLDISGNLRIGGSTQANYISFIGTNGENNIGEGHSYIGERIYGGIERSELLLFKGNDATATDGPDRIRLLAAEHRFDTYSTPLSGTFDGIGTSGTTRVIITTNGNMGIGLTSPAYALDVNGTVSANAYTGGSIQLSGDAILVGSGTFSGSVGSSMIEIGGSEVFKLSNQSGYKSIQSYQGLPLILNASGNNVGIFTTSPSANLDVNGTFNCNNTSTFSGNISSLNSSTASLTLINGGISVNNNTNSTSVTMGGSMTLAGGASIGKDLYIGGNLNVLSNANTIGSLFATNITSAGLISTNIIGASITAGTIKVDSSIDANGSINTIGNIIMTGGNIGFGTISPNAALHINTTNTFGTLYLSNSIQNRKVVMHSNGNNDHQYYGMGINAGSYRFQVDASTANFDYYAAASASSSTALMRLSGTGDLSVYGSISGVSYTGGNMELSGEIVSNSLTIKNGLTTSVSISANGNTTINSTTSSSNVSTGSLVVSGGVGIGQNLNVLGNTIIQGDLTVSGSTTTIDSVNATVKDNIYVLNSGPSGTRDSGFIIQRYQIDNNTGSGDVVNDTRYIQNTLPDQTGMASTQIKLGPSAIGSDNYYVGWWIKISSGFTTNQVRKITAYTGSTRIATVSSAWNTQNPAIGDNVSLYNKPYVGVIYNEINDRFEFGGTIQDPGETNVSFSDNIPIYGYSLTVNSTQHSANSTTGSFISYGGVSIACTSNSVSATQGGSITTLGGAGIGKDLFVGENLYVNGPIMKIPSGNNATRPSAPEVGYIYYNTDSTEYQGYLASGSWVSLSATGTLSDLDGNTKIQAEAYSGSNDNNLIFYTNGFERMRMDSAGSIGIGTSAPSAIFQVSGTCLLDSTTNSVGVGSGGNLTVLGGASFSKDIYVGGTVTSSSDIRLKENITHLNYDKKEKISNKLNKLRTIKFNYKHDDSSKRQIGFIAQDFEKDFPELLRKPDENGYYTLDYSKITVLLVESIKELTSEIKNLKRRIYHLENQDDSDAVYYDSDGVCYE